MQGYEWQHIDFEHPAYEAGQADACCRQGFHGYRYKGKWRQLAHYTAGYDQGLEALIRAKLDEVDV